MYDVKAHSSTVVCPWEWVASSLLDCQHAHTLCEHIDKGPLTIGDGAVEVIRSVDYMNM